MSQFQNQKSKTQNVSRNFSVLILQALEQTSCLLWHWSAACTSGVHWPLHTYCSSHVTVFSMCFQSFSLCSRLYQISSVNKSFSFIPDDASTSDLILSLQVAIFFLCNNLFILRCIGRCLACMCIGVPHECLGPQQTTKWVLGGN